MFKFKSCFFLISLFFSAFFLSSCMHIKKCCKKEAMQYEEGQTKKACCKKSDKERKGKKCSGKSDKCDKGKKCCRKSDKCKKGKKSCGKSDRWKKGKKSCGKSDKGKKGCGTPDLAGHAIVKGLGGKKITGDVFFESFGPREMKVTAQFKGLTANKKMGFHIHEFGTCENKGLMAGGHLNPWKQKHGGPKAHEKHLGDLGNLSSNAKGEAVYSLVMKGRLNKILGRSVIVHANEDDLKNQPSGNAGERVACGIITASMPPVEESKEEPAK